MCQTTVVVEELKTPNYKMESSNNFSHHLRLFYIIEILKEILNKPIWQKCLFFIEYEIFLYLLPKYIYFIF